MKHKITEWILWSTVIIGILIIMNAVFKHTTLKEMARRDQELQLKKIEMIQ